MLSKNQIKFITSLSQKKFRREHGLFAAEGEKVVLDLLNSSFDVKQVYLTEDFFQKHFSKSERRGKAEFVIIKENEVERISSLTTPQEVLAVAAIPKHQLQTDSLKDSLTLLLDDIRDPGNLGTIIRIADWFGIENVICSETSADAYNPKTVQAAMGSLFRVNVISYKLIQLLEENKNKFNLPVYGTLLEGENIFESNLSQKGFIVIGNESNGISGGVRKFISNVITIPSFHQHKNSSPDSLNVAVATAIVCAEFRRRG